MRRDLLALGTCPRALRRAARAAWFASAAYDMRLMMAGIQKFGMQEAEVSVERLQTLQGRPLRSYEPFVREAIGGV